MAKIRAYKLAEELGIERGEFVEQAAQVGVELKSAMASLDEAEVELLREKLGGVTAAKKSMDEHRLEGKSGTTVVRRRKRKEPEPEPEPIPEPEAIAEVTAAPSIDEPSTEEIVSTEATDEPAGEKEGVAAGAATAEGAAAKTDSGGPAPKAPAPTGPRDARGVATPGQGDAAGGAADKKGKQRKRVREVVNLQEQEQFARQITSRGSGQRRVVTTAPRSAINPRARRRDKLSPKPSVATLEASKTRHVKVSGDISIGELSKQAGLKAPAIQGKLMALGIMVSVNQRIDFETVQKISGEMGFEASDVGFKEEEFLATTPSEVESTGETGNETTRPPIITVMGHVDHGKTSLLDAIRKTKVTDEEAGGITQHVGAYQVTAGGHALTFIDTPGHAAFTAMRARGAAVTDLVVLVIAATEGVMPQTVEAIEHAQAAGCPIVVAVNKCDLPGADPAMTRQRLMEHNVVVEDFGGDVLAIDISAIKRTGLDKLLDALALQAEVLEPSADPNIRVKGVVLEAQLEKGRGPVATVLVQEGTLRRGDVIVAGPHSGRVRSMSNERGEVLQEARPSSPVQVVGLSGVPDAGESMHAVESERVAKDIVSHRLDQARGRVKSAPKPKMSLEDLFAQAEGGGPKELNIIIKADTQGSAEAVRDSMIKLTTDQVTLTVLHASVGGVTERDVQLAEASQAVIIGFHVRPDVKARRLAESSGVDIRSYQIIYEAIDEVRAAMAGLLPPTRSELILGQAQVRETFVIPKVGTIAGSYVTDGLVRRNAQCRLVRDGVQVFAGGFASLKRFKDDVREVQTGFECGIGVQGFNDVKVGDIIEAYVIEERPAEL
jgi:translation initiation factor IF-2